MIHERADRRRRLDRLAGIAQHLFDPVVGVIGGLEEVPREAGGPDFFHYLARSCDTAAFQRYRAFSFAGGASTTREGAIAKSIGEAVERYCAAFYDADALPLVASAKATFPCVAPAEFALYGEAQYRSPGFPWVPFTDRTPVRWTPAVDQVSGATVHVPACRVFIPYYFVAGTGDSPIDQPISTGLACHGTWADAALGAVCEVIERDAALIAWQAMMSPPQVRIETLSDANYDLVRRFEAVGDEVALLDITLDHGVPTFLSVLRSRRAGAPALVCAPATALDPEIAVRKSLEELAHTRRYCQWVITNAPRLEPDPPEYLAVHDQRSHLNFYVDRANAHHADFLFTGSTRREFSDLANHATGDAAIDLARVVERIAGVGHRVLLAELTTPEIAALGLAVVRAVIPGFHSLHMGFSLRAQGGQRLWTTPQRLGHRGVTVAGGDNPAPHPYP